MDKLGPYLLGPNDENQGIYTGDARELAQAIPDESVDLIFTDPVYDRIDDYRWLAKTAARVLKPDSACLVWIASPRIKAVLFAMDDLAFVMPLSYVVRGKSFMMFSRRVFCWTTPCLWFEKGKSSNRVFVDTIIAGGKVDGVHRWNKNITAFKKWMVSFTESTDVIFDPFTGGGTVPAVCKMLGRRWLAFEIDPPTADLARKRVRETQPPLFVPQPEQVRMEL